MTSGTPLLTPCPWEQRLGRSISWLVSGALLAVTPWILYRGVFDLWWASDDLNHILYALRHTPFEYFFNAGVYTQFHPSFFAPWNIVGYDVDLALFGVEPAGHYAHRLVSFGAVLIATFFTLRCWVNTPWALVGSALFACSGPAAAVVTQLMNVHYLEGLLFTLASVLCFVASLRRGRPALAWAGAAFYLLAMLAKEIYVPIGLVLLMLPEGSPRQRISRLIPYALAVIVYLVWRWLMLGMLATPSGVPGNLDSFLTLPLRIPWMLLQAGAVSAVALAALAVAGAFVARRSLRAWALVAATAVVLLAPLVTIAHRITGPERALVLWSWALSAFVAVILGRLAGRGPRGLFASALILLGVGVATATLGLGARDAIYKRSGHFRAVGEFVMTHGADTGLYLPRESFAARRAVHLKAALDLGAAPRIFAAGRFADSTAQDLSLYTYRPGIGQIVPITLSELRHVESRRARQAPLSVELWQTEAGTRWRFGPYADKRYTVFIPARDVYIAAAPPEGIVANGTPAMQFYVWYDSPEGWRAYSDELTWENGPEERLSWRRD